MLGLQSDAICPASQLLGLVKDRLFELRGNAAKRDTNGPWVQLCFERYLSISAKSCPRCSVTYLLVGRNILNGFLRG